MAINDTLFSFVAFTVVSVCGYLEIAQSGTAASSYERSDNVIQNEAFQSFLAVADAWDDPFDTLDGDALVNPPVDDFGYLNTPANSLTFLKMGVDGVHTAILKRDGVVREDSPVIYISPMDSDEWTILAPTFVDYLADGCAVPRERIIELLDAVEGDPAALVRFLSANFDRGRLLTEDRVNELNDRYLHLVEKKDEYEEMKGG